MDRAEMRVKRIKIAGKKRRDDDMRKKKRIRIKRTEKTLYDGDLKDNKKNEC